MRDYDVTSATVSAELERQHRMKVYFIMMAIRMACVASLIWVRGWWILVAAIGGVLLPYLAVLIANQPKYTAPETPEQPEPRELTSATPASTGAVTLIVVDEPADRKSGRGTSVVAEDLETLTPEYLNRDGESS